MARQSVIGAVAIVVAAACSSALVGGSSVRAESSIDTPVTPPRQAHVVVARSLWRHPVSVMDAETRWAGLAIDGPTVSIAETGAVADNRTVNTAAIQRAVTQCTTQFPGGCTVVVPAGAYKTGSISLASNLRFHLAAGAGLYGSSDPNDYRVSYQWFGGHPAYNYNSLLFGHNLTNVLVTGSNGNDPSSAGNVSIVDGVGWPWWCQARCTPLHQPWCDAFNPTNATLPKDQLPKPQGQGRPRLINIFNSTHVTLAGFTAQNSPQWTVHVQNSQDVLIANMTVLSPRAVGNTDGVDPESSEDVLVTDTHIDVGDDGVSIKSYNISGADGGTVMIPCRRIAMRRLVIRSRNWCIGSGTFGGVSEVLFEDSVVGDSDVPVPWAFKFKSHQWFPGPIENITVRRIRVGPVGPTPWMYPKGEFKAFELGLTYSGKAPSNPSGIPLVRNITFEDIHITSADSPGSITGLKGSCFEHLTLRNVTFGSTGSAKWGCSDIQASTFVTDGVVPAVGECQGACSPSR